MESGCRGGAAVVVWGDSAAREMIYLTPHSRQVRQPDDVALGVGVRRFVLPGHFIVPDSELQSAAPRAVLLSPLGRRYPLCIEFDCNNTTFISFSKNYFLHVRKNPYLCIAFIS